MNCTYPKHHLAPPLAPFLPLYTAPPVPLVIPPNFVYTGQFFLANTQSSPRDSYSWRSNCVTRAPNNDRYSGKVASYLEGCSNHLKSMTSNFDWQRVTQPISVGIAFIHHPVDDVLKVLKGHFGYPVKLHGIAIQAKFATHARWSVLPSPGFSMATVLADKHGEEGISLIVRESIDE